MLVCGAASFRNTLEVLQGRDNFAQRNFFFFLQSEDSVLNRSSDMLTMKKQEDGPSAGQDIALGS